MYAARCLHINSLTIKAFVQHWGLQFIFIVCIETSLYTLLRMRRDCCLHTVSRSKLSCSIRACTLFLLCIEMSLYTLLGFQRGACIETVQRSKLSCSIGAYTLSFTVCTETHLYTLLRIQRGACIHSFTIKALVQHSCLHVVFYSMY